MLVGYSFIKLYQRLSISKYILNIKRMKNKTNFQKT